MPAPHIMGIYPPDSVSEVASSLPLDPLSPGTSETLAADVEYRLHLIIQEAKKYMIHGKRGCLTAEDVEFALEALGVEPILIPPKPLPQESFTPLHIPLPNGTFQTLYHVPDDEIDFATYLKQPLPPGLANSAGVKWKAHWLAVEGVQPAIPENPAPSLRAGPSRSPTTGPSSLSRSAKSHLPQESQLYFTRLTTALVPTPSSSNTDTPLPESERHRLAALASLRSDSAVSGILVYLVKWFNESVGRCLMGSTGVLGGLISGIEALLENEAIFLEPYLHQLLPPLLSVLLTVPLGPHPPTGSSGDKQPTPFELRIRAAEVLGKIAGVYGGRYAGLIPRLVSTLTRTLQTPPFPSPLGASTPPAGRYEGAILGLSALGPTAVQQSIWAPNGQGLHRIDNLTTTLYPGKGKPALMKATIKALQLIVRPKPDGWNKATEMTLVVDAFGVNVGRGLEKRPWLAGELLRMRTEGLNGIAGEEGGVMEVDTPRE